MDIQLHFINESSDGGNTHVVIYQKPPFGASVNPAADEEPLAAERLVALPPAGERVTVAHQGDSVVLGVAPSAPGEVADPADVQAPVQLALPRAPFATIRVRGGGTEPVTFALAPD